MSTPTDSVAPPFPTGTSAPWPMPAWWKKIADWIAALSPSGADKYDTGWVDIPRPGGLILKARRIGQMATLYIDGPHSLPNNAIVDVVPSGVIPAEFRPVLGAFRAAVTADTHLMTGIIYPDGLLRVVNRSGATREVIQASLIGPYPVN